MQLNRQDQKEMRILGGGGGEKDSLREERDRERERDLLGYNVPNRGSWSGHSPERGIL